MFLAQTVVAALLAVMLSFLTATRVPAAPLTSQILMILALLGLPVAATMAYVTARAGGKGAALAATIMAGVLLAVPAWFLAFAVLIGSGDFYLILLLFVVVNAYAVGFFLCSRFAAFALITPVNPEKDASAEQVQRQVETH